MRMRLELLTDDAYNWEEERQEAGQQPVDAAAEGLSGEGGGGGPTHPLLRKGQADKAGSFALPRRVLIPWKVGLGRVVSGNRHDNICIGSTYGTCGSASGPLRV